MLLMWRFSDWGQFGYRELLYGESVLNRFTYRDRVYPDARYKM